MNTTPVPAITLLVCSECGVGTFRRSILTGRVECQHCRTAIYSGDIELDPGETLAWDGLRRLGYTTSN